jgi:hypothetical protein
MDWVGVCSALAALYLTTVSDRPLTNTTRPPQSIEPEGYIDTIVNVEALQQCFWKFDINTVILFAIFMTILFFVSEYTARNPR